MQSLSPWQEIELELRAHTDYIAQGFNPYVDIAVWADFRHSSGQTLQRPAFWDGENCWKIRFASPYGQGQWDYRTFAALVEGNQSLCDPGLAGQAGQLLCAPWPQTPENVFLRRGFWRMSQGARNLVFADGTPCLLVADTAWALPWRATPDETRHYAHKRRAQGFNAALLMTLQSDLNAQGPRNRFEDESFEVGFEDLPQGTLQRIVVEYFQVLDELCAILIEHEIVPVYQPVFHGYGWKGGGVAGPLVSGADYARFCRYLVARYGARPAMYLLGGDGHGYYASIGEAGRAVEECDAYSQPTGLHYCPHADNRAYQEANWLDFQWCQTGHDGQHKSERVADMWRNHPPKAVANGEPTYENMGEAGRAQGWWQGHEAWCNLCAGGTMGAVYGAASLWQWKRHPNEKGHADWCQAARHGWREALEFEGANYVGVLTKIFEGLPFTDIAPNWDYTLGKRGLAIPDRLLMVYEPDGGDLLIVSEKVPAPFRILSARNGQELARGELQGDPKGFRSAPVPAVLEREPLIFLFCADFS